MGGWVRIEADWLEELTRELAGGHPWPAPLCLMDLRALEHLEDGIPSVAALARRWNRSRKFVRARLDSPWPDLVAREHRAKFSARDRRGTGEGQARIHSDVGATPEMEPPGTGEGQARDRQGYTSEKAPPPTRARDHRSPITDHLSLFQRDTQQETPDGVPAWARKGIRQQDGTPHAVLGLVVRALEGIRQQRVNPQRCKTDAGQVLKLWRSLDRPPLAEFVEELELVAEAARECDAPIFARWLRAEGWTDGVDRSRSVDTLTRQDKWADRLAAARAWAAEGKRSRSDSRTLELVQHNDAGDITW